MFICLPVQGEKKLLLSPAQLFCQVTCVGKDSLIAHGTDAIMLNSIAPWINLFKFLARCSENEQWGHGRLTWKICGWFLPGHSQIQQIPVQ